MSGRLLQFGAFELDSAAGELRKHGIKIKLQEQPLQILQKLLERPGEVVTREELQKRIWPADTFVDFDHGLYSAVQRLRDALGDTAETPRYVETLPRRGYRFIGLVKNGNCVEDEPKMVRAEERPLVALEPPAPRRNLRAAMFVAAGTILVALLFALAFKSERLLGRPAVPAIHSIAVLPLQNLSNDPSQEYFADGMTEELITDLSQISALRVASHQSVSRYKKSDKPLPEIARELNVDALVEGSVQRAGDRVRITAQLIYAPEDKNVFAKSYERDFQDVLQLQGTLAAAIADEVRIKMTAQEKANLTSAQPVNPTVLKALWEGQYHSDLGYDATLFKGGKRETTEDEYAKAIYFLELAIKEDPNYIPARLALAQHVLDRRPPNVGMVAEAKSGLARVLAMDDSNLTAHILMAQYLIRFEGNWDAAGMQYKRVVEVNPYSAQSHDAYGSYLDNLGRFQEGMEEHRKAQALDHDKDSVGSSPLITPSERLERQQKFLPPTTYDVWLRGNIEYENGKYADSFRDWLWCVRFYGWNEEADAVQRAYERNGALAGVREIARLFDQIARSQWLQLDVVLDAELYAGNKEGVLAWLQTSYDEHNDIILHLISDRRWDPYRSDPRFKEIVRRVGLSE
jgi:TolB-like protein/DNA-binding winged helix-turn-helix (wHTH) protein